jgi:catechol 2,3-dioxygenase-like lactoylglutathione lyase family enzyme
VHVVLAVDDVERAKRFYDDAFGWKPHLEWPDRYAELVLSEDDRLGLYVRDGFAASAGIKPDAIGDAPYTGAEVYVQVEDLEDAIERLGAAGATPLSPRREREWGHEAAYFADPDGNVVAVARPLPQ